MRYVTVRITPKEGTAFHPLGQALSDDPSVTREAVHRNELLDDGTCAMLAEARGDRNRYEEILEESLHVLDYAVTGTDCWWYSYTHYEPTDLTRRMLQQRGESEVMMEMPYDVAEDGSMEITFVGDEQTFAGAMPMGGDAFTIEVLETGDHHPEVDDLFGTLTARQQEILDTAVRLGYYQNPRKATHEEIADQVDASPSTVGEHLRKIESHVFSEFVQTGAAGDTRRRPKS
ncbi:helix-turn-helix domain-containing protein [Halostella pelagica]|uniref:helix-turn-helix domain-containing protein n=1 Tax=Halostella pelagica TaxID=2583824 RepID=UPI0010816AB8|nr:helix-turn-helix domain-containing protein [Halostella pelagica]